MDIKGILLWAGFVLIAAVIVIVSRRMKKQIEENGTEADGVVSRIEDAGGTDEVDLRYYVKYRTEDGEEIEGLLSNPRADLTVGEQVRIRYHPVHKMNARLV